MIGKGESEGQRERERKEEIKDTSLRFNCELKRGVCDIHGHTQISGIFGQKRDGRTFCVILR